LLKLDGSLLVKVARSQALGDLLRRKLAALMSVGLGPARRPVRD